MTTLALQPSRVFPAKVLARRHRWSAPKPRPIPHLLHQIRTDLWPFSRQKSSPARHSALVVSSKTIDNERQRARVGC